MWCFDGAGDSGNFGVSGEGFDGSDDLGANDDDDGVWLICIGWRVIVRLSGDLPVSP